MAGPATLYQTGDHASRPANGAGCVLYTCTDHGLVYRDDGSSWSTWLTLPGAGAATTWADLDDDHDAHDHTGVPGVGSGSGGGTIERFDVGAAPGSPDAADDEFEDASITGWTRVHNAGTPKGSWSENHGSLSWRQTATGATELDVYAKARAISIGDYVEAGGRIFVDTNTTLGLFVGFSNGTVFGTSNAVGTFWHANSARNRFMLNPWPGHNTRGTDGTPIFDRSHTGVRWYVRVKYEAANSWGLYVSPDGHNWLSVQTLAYTMTPTHVAFGMACLSTMAPTNWVVFDYVRVNAA